MQSVNPGSRVRLTGFMHVNRILSSRCVAAAAAAILISSAISLRSSTDPLNQWYLRNPSPTGYGLSGIAYGNGVFVAVGNSGIVLTSVDGISWSDARPVPYTLRGVTFGNGLFVAVAWTGQILSSTNATQWIERRSVP